MLRSPTIRPGSSGERNIGSGESSGTGGGRGNAAPSPPSSVSSLGTDAAAVGTRDSKGGRRSTGLNQNTFFSGPLSNDRPPFHIAPTATGKAAEIKPTDQAVTDATTAGTTDVPSEPKQGDSRKAVSLGFGDGLANWNVQILGGSDQERGSVRAGSAVLNEGDSFLVGLDRSFTIPADDPELLITFTELNFDTSDSDSINDAFEASLLDAQGNSITYTIGKGYDAFFNITEDQPPALGEDTSLSGDAIKTVRVDLSNVPDGTVATLRFRLVNNDEDTQTSVRILDVQLTGDTTDLAPTATVGLLNDTAPTGTGTTGFQTDRLTNDPRVTGRATDDRGVSRLEARVNSGPYQDITAQLTGEDFTFDPGPQPAGAHSITIRVTDIQGQTAESVLEFRVNAPPVPRAGGPYESLEGGLIQLDAAGSTDAENGIFDYAWSFDDGSAANGITTDRSYVQDGVYPVVLTVTDTAGSTASDLVPVTIDNLPPVVTVPAAQIVVSRTRLEISSLFSDPGTLDTHTATIVWGDGTPTEPAIVELHPGGGTVFGSHTFDHAGLFWGTITVVDERGAMGTALFPIAVVDPALDIEPVGPQQISEGNPLSVATTFVDGNGPLEHTAEIDWGDGSPRQSLTVQRTANGGTIAGEHRYLDNGIFQATLTIRNDVGGEGTTSFSVSVENQLPSVITSPVVQTVQYSDLTVPISITAHDVTTDLLSIETSFRVNGGALQAGLPGGLELTGEGGPGTGSWQIAGKALTSPGTYDIRIAASDDDGGTSFADVQLQVNQEDARVTFTGPPFVTTSSAASGQATVTLRATIQDITAADPSTDAQAGDIRNATVSFINRDTGAVIASGLPVALADSTDLKVGIVTYDWPVDLGNADFLSFTIGIVVNGYYTGNQSTDETIVNVSRPQALSITGGGFLVNESSAGKYAGDVGLRTNFGFNVKFNKKLTNLKGHVNIIIRHGENVYQIKSSALSSLTLDPNIDRGVLTAKANLTDVTDPHNSISLGGNLHLEMTVTDRGEPGDHDSLSIVLWKQNELLYASRWSGAQVVEQILRGGNLAVHRDNGLVVSAAAKQTKFFVADSSADKVFRYGSAGEDRSVYALPTTVPNAHGIASDVTGATVWVLDASGKIVVQDPDGNMRGSWTATGVSAGEDIATDGVDIWIVDSASRSVMAYPGAAFLTAGSVAATSSLVLHPDNQQPSGLATNGQTMWVTDAASDEVFVYSKSGSLLGRWRLDSANGDASGITLNPSGGNSLWVVDRQDLLVYQYDAATDRTDGAAVAALTIPLRSGNGSPEGIADPPVTESSGALPRLMVESPMDGAKLEVGSTAIISGSVSSDGKMAVVTIDNRAVDVLDPTGRFFSSITVLPGRNEFEIAAIDSLGLVGTTTLTIEGTQSVSGEVDFAHLSDVSSSLAPIYGRTTFDSTTDVLSAALSIHNAGTYPVDVPLILGVTNLSDPSVRVQDTDGTTSAGIPYFDFSDSVAGGKLAIDAISEQLWLSFWNPQHVSFTYDLVVLGVLNRAPVITSVPDVEAIVGRPYTMQVNANDPDGDVVRYELLMGPADMEIDALNGAVTWRAAADDVGNVPVSVMVADGRGGRTEQRYTLATIELPPNRPPVFATVPVVEAQIGATYQYHAHADDADGDVLTYSLSNGPTSMIINASSGEVTWNPTNISPLDDLTSAVRVVVTDVHGGQAVQDYNVVLRGFSGNQAPVIISQPLTDYSIPGDVHPPRGEVGPNHIALTLTNGESSIQNVSVQNPPAANSPQYADVVFTTQSGSSLQTELNWMGEVVQSLDQSLGNLGSNENRFGLVSMGDWYLAPGAIPLGLLTGIEFASVELPVTFIDKTQTADLDIDGDIDVVVGLDHYVLGFPGFVVFLNDGMGHLSLPAYYAGGQTEGISDFDIADFDGDGNLDVAGVSYDPFGSTSTVAILRGNGDGTFSHQGNLSVLGGWATSLDIGDVNADGHADIVVGDTKYGAVSLLLGTDNGTFSIQTLFQHGQIAHRDIEVRDLDGDGDDDIAFGAVTGILIYLSNGDGSFVGSGQIPRLYASEFGLGDVDGDEDLDLVFLDNDLQVWLNDGDANFTEVNPQSRIQALFQYGNTLEMTDLDGDGDLDLLIGDLGSEHVATVMVFVGDGHGRFTAQASYSNGSFPAPELATGDMNGDGHVDFISTMFGNKVAIVRGNGDGTFGAAVNYATRTSVKAVQVGDLNGDRFADVVVLNDIGMGYSILFAGPEGEFVRRFDYPSDAATWWYTSVLGDVDDDGDLDLTLSTGDRIEVHINDGNGQFIRGFAATAGSVRIASGDINGDSKLDLVTADNFGCEVFLGDGAGEFFSGPVCPFAGYPFGGYPLLSLGDVNEDGYSDLITFTPDNSAIEIAFGNAAGSFLPSTRYLTPNGSRTAILGDVEGDGDIDILTNTALLLNDGSGVFGSPQILDLSEPLVGMVAGELTGDGKLDLLVTTARSQTSSGGYAPAAVFVMAGDGVGNFTLRRTPILSNHTETPFYSSAVGDLNGDGHLDVIASSSFRAAVSSLLNDGYGDFGYFGSAAEFAHAIRAVRDSDGRIGKGYEALAESLQYSFRSEASVVSVLIDDGSRISGEHSFAEVYQLLQHENAILNTIVDAQFQDSAGNVALGMMADGRAIVADGIGGYSLVPGGHYVSGAAGVKEEYVDLAWLTGGIAWDIRQLREGGLTREVFTRAFVEQSTGQLAPSVPVAIAASEPGVIVENLTGTLPDLRPGDTASFELRITGDGKSHDFDVLFVHDGTGEVLGSIPVAINGSPWTYSVNAIDPDGDQLAYRLIDSPVGAHLDNATGDVTWTPAFPGEFDFRIEVSDGRGGSATQAFKVIVSNPPPNQAPIIISQPLTDYSIPGDVHPPRGEVLPAVIHEVLDPDDGVEPSVQITLTTAAPSGTADIVFVTQESASMATEHGWIGRLADPLDAALVQHGLVQNRYGLVGAKGNFLYPDPDSDNASYPVSPIPLRELADVQLLTGGENALGRVYTADLDGDGDQDIVAAQPNSGLHDAVLVFLNPGDGAFTLSATYRGGEARGAHDLSIVDVDNDGILDVVAASPGIFSNSTVGILKGRGDGTFEQLPDIPTAITYAWRIGTADLDNDGDIDIVVTDHYSNTLTLLFGDGEGGFASRIDYTLPTIGGSFGVVTGDIDSDADIDIVVGVNGGGAIVLTNDGSGSLSTSSLIEASSGSEPAPMVDLDHDGDLDLVFGSGDLQVFLNDGSGQFAQGISHFVGYGAQVVVDDVNSDGHPDALVIMKERGIAVNLGDGTGRFSSPIYYPYNTGYYGNGGVSVADIDSDGIRDIVGTIFAGTVGIIRGVGDGAFATLPYGLGVLSMRVPSVEPLSTGDINGDGNLDVLATSGTEGRFAVLFGDGHGGLTNVAEHRAEQLLNITTSVLGDIDGDDALDVVASDSISTRAHLGNGHGGFDEYFSLNIGAIDVQLGDVTADSHVDLLLLTPSGELLTFKGRGDGTFDRLGELLGVKDFELGDFNRDGVTDVLTLGSDVRTLLAHFGQSSGIGGNQTLVQDDKWISYFDVGDIDGDGDLDIATYYNGDVVVLKNDGGADFTELAPVQISEIVAGMSLVEITGDGRADLIVQTPWQGGIVGGYRDNTDLAIFVGDGAGSFQRRGRYTSPSTSFFVDEAVPITVSDMNSDGVGDIVLANSYSSVVSVMLNDGYGDFGRFGSAADLTNGVAALMHLPVQPVGGDVFAALAAGLDYSMRPDSVVAAVVVDDGNRIGTGPTFSEVYSALQRENSVLSVVVNAQFQDGLGNPALGVTADGMAIVTDGSGAYVTRSGGQFVSGLPGVKEEYVDLAWLTGGIAWDIQQLRLGNLSEEIFVQAFIDQFASNLPRSIPVNVTASDPRVNFENRTGVVADVAPGETASFDVRITGDGQAHQFDLLFVHDETGELLGSIPVAINGSPWYYPLKAVDSEGDLLSYRIIEAPEGATIDSLNGLVQWTPVYPGEFQFRVEVADDRGGNTEQQFTVTVQAGQPNNHPTITGQSPTQATTGIQYVAAVTATDTDGDLLFYFGFEVPDGLTIDRHTGATSWTPSADQVGLHSIQLLVLDGRGGSATQEFEILVSAPIVNAFPRIVSQPPTSVTVRELWRYDAQASDADEDPLTWTLAVGPPGMALDPTTGTVVWTPLEYQFAPVDVILRVDDGRGGRDLQRFTVQLDRANQPPEITSIAPGRAVVGLPNLYQVRAQDADNDQLSFSLSSYPTGMQIDASTGLIHWTPTAGQVGHHDITVAVTDFGGAPVEGQLSFDVSADAVNNPPAIVYPLGQLVARVGTENHYQLEATDLDGDPLTFFLNPNLNDAGQRKW